MPPRWLVVLIVAGWLATTAALAFREFWFTGPPPFTIDPTLEVTGMSTPVEWQVFWGERPAGELTTRVVYRRSDDTCEFVTRFKDLKLNFEVLPAILPGVEARFDLETLHSSTRVNRGGALVERSTSGKGRLAVVTPFGFTALRVDAERLSLVARVVNGELLARAGIDARAAGAPLLALEEELPPVPAPTGSALDPTQPTDRLPGLHPGQRWRQPTSDALGEVMVLALERSLRSSAILGDASGMIRGRIADFTPKELIAEVSSQTRPLEWDGAEVPCLVIEYRDNNEVKARTWVHARTEQVLRQEAYLFGQTLSIRREAPKGGGQ